MDLKTRQVHLVLEPVRHRGYKAMAHRMEQTLSDWMREALDQHVARCYEKLTGLSTEAIRAESIRERNARARPIIDKILAQARDARVSALELVELAETLPSRNPALWCHKPIGDVVEKCLVVVKARSAQRLNDCGATRQAVEDAMELLEFKLTSVHSAVASIAREGKSSNNVSAS